MLGKNTIDLGRLEKTLSHNLLKTVILWSTQRVSMWIMQDREQMPLRVHLSMLRFAESCTAA